MRRDTEQYLMHYGKKGMRWGVRRATANLLDKSSEFERGVANDRRKAAENNSLLGKLYRGKNLRRAKYHDREADAIKKMAEYLRDSANRSDVKTSAKLMVKSKKASEMSKYRNQEAKNNLAEAKKLKNRKLTPEDRKEITRRQVLRDEAHNQARRLESAAASHEFAGNIERANELRSQAYQYRLQADTHNDTLRRIASNSANKEKAASLESAAAGSKRKAEYQSKKAKKLRAKSKFYSIAPIYTKS